MNMQNEGAPVATSPSYTPTKHWAAI
jgi:hypothetical protein